MGRLVFLVRGVQPEVGAGAYWGLVWGWAPAWIAASAGCWSSRNRSGTGRATTVVRLLPAVGFAVVLVAAMPLASEANRNAAPVPVAAELVPAPIPIGQPDATYAIEPGAPGTPHPDGRHWCAGDDVAMSLGGGDAATGHRAQQLLVENTSTRACRLGTYPDVAFDDPDGNAMNVLFYRGGSFMTEDPGPGVVVLQPGETATAMMGWNAMAPGGSTTPGTVLVAPYAGADRMRLAVNGPGGELALDIVDGGAVAITAWSPGG
ncbi:DUF4232 domain-containing protein [Arthrobacter sp. JSM 101049]|uniref:DUF4232 domain-containing protein n=1 Tax=Arthrobacter sp. JSM 101049 TaxID=929097 RepID=UPI00356A85EC